LGLENFFSFPYWYFTFLDAGNVFRPQKTDFCGSRGGGNTFLRPELISAPAGLFYNHMGRKKFWSLGFFPPSKLQKSGAFGMLYSVKPPENSV